MSDFEQLKPCPFCGAGETLIVHGPSTWAGMRSSEPSTYSVRHWCDPIKGQPSRMLERIGRDKQSAIDAWNTRAAERMAAIVDVACQVFDRRDGCVE